MFGWIAKQTGKFTREMVDVAESIYNDMASMPDNFAKGYKKVPTKTDIIIEEIKRKKHATKLLSHS